MPDSLAYSSSSGGDACPEATQGQPWGSTLGVRDWFKGDLSEKKFCDGCWVIRNPVKFLLVPFLKLGPNLHSFRFLKMAHFLMVVS